MRNNETVIAVNNEWQVITPVNNDNLKIICEKEEVVFGGIYGLEVYLKQSGSEPDTIYINVQRSINSDSSYVGIIRCLCKLTPYSSSIEYSEFMAVLAVAAQIPIKFLVSTGLPRGGWAIAAQCVSDDIEILKKLKQQYPECKKIIIEPPIYITGKGGDIFESFKDQDITLSGIYNSDVDEASLSV